MKHDIEIGDHTIGEAHIPAVAKPGRAKSSAKPRAAQRGRASIPNNIPELAAYCFEHEANNVVAATELMSKIVAKDEVLFRKLLEPLLNTACYNTITSLCRKDRKRVWEAPVHGNGADRANVTALAQAVKETLLDFLLPGGQALRYANKQQVEEASEFYGKQGRDMMVKSVWLSSVASKLSDDESVEDALDARALEKLRSRAVDGINN